MRIRDVYVKLRQWPGERHHVARADLVEEQDLSRLLETVPHPEDRRLPGDPQAELQGAIRSMGEIMIASQRQQAPAGLRFRNECLEVILADGGVIGYPVARILYWRAGPERESAAPAPRQRPKGVT